MLIFWLYLVMQPADMMMAVIAAIVLVFPTRRAVFFEVQQRIRATLYGGAIALAVLALFTLSPHLPVLLGLIFLGGLWLGNQMLPGPYPSMVYQYAYSVALANSRCALYAGPRLRHFHPHCADTNGLAWRSA